MPPFVVYEAYLERITYKPGWAITIRRDNFGLVLRFASIVIDVNDHDQAVYVIAPKPVPPDLGFEEFCRFLVSAVRELEIHETKRVLPGRRRAFRQTAPPPIPVSKGKFKRDLTTVEVAQVGRAKGADFDQSTGQP